MQRILLLSLLLLASCSSHQEHALSAQPPGLDVANVALANGAPDTALHIAQLTLAADPHNVSALICAATAQVALNQNEQATHTFGQALALEPNNADASLGLARLELRTDPAAAAAVLLQLTKRDPKNVAAMIDLGIAKDLLGRHEEAQQAYRRALSLQPESVAGQVNLGLSLALSGDPQQGLRILRPLGSSSGALPQVRQDLAVAFVLAGNDDEAQIALRSDIPKSEALAMIAGYHLLQTNP